MRLALELLLFAHVWMAALVIPVGLWHLATHPELWIDLTPAPRRRRRRRRHLRRPPPSSLYPMFGALVPGVVPR